jgi:hypothetical protein
MSQSRQKPQTAVKRRPKSAPRPADLPQAANRDNASPAVAPSSHVGATDRSDPEPDPKDGLSDQEWLEALPLYTQLRGIPQSL